MKALFQLIEDDKIERGVSAALIMPCKMSAMVVEMMMLGMTKDSTLDLFSKMWDEMEVGRRKVEGIIRADLEAKSNAGG